MYPQYNQDNNTVSFPQSACELEAPIQQANVMAAYPSTPIHLTNYGSSFSRETMTRTLIENPTDADLGFPALLPLASPDSADPPVENLSWIAGIDRIPAHLMSRKVCRRAYEFPGKAVIITGLPLLYEQKAQEKKQNQRDFATQQAIQYPDVVSDGCEVKHLALQDKKRSQADIEKFASRRKTFVPPSLAHDANYPLFFWTIPYLADLSQDEIHQIRTTGS